MPRAIGEQFTPLRDGDRFYYEHFLPRELIDLVEAQPLSRIIRRNTDIGQELSDDVFVTQNQGGDPPPRQRRR